MRIELRYRFGFRTGASPGAAIPARLTVHMFIMAGSGHNGLDGHVLSEQELMAENEADRCQSTLVRMEVNSLLSLAIRLRKQKESESGTVSGQLLQGFVAAGKSATGQYWQQSGNKEGANRPQLDQSFRIAVSANGDGAEAGVGQRADGNDGRQPVGRVLHGLPLFGEPMNESTNPEPTDDRSTPSGPDSRAKRRERVAK